jgi:triacylglycerol lipase
VRTNLDLEEETYPAICTAVEKTGGVPRVHKGFLKAWKSIEEPVWDKVSNVMLRYAGSGKVVVCGHSLGGALATLAGMDLFCKVEASYQKSLSVITFGSPRVGNDSFRTLYAATIPRSLRVVTVYDPVPKTTVNDFVHVPDEYMIPGAGINPHALGTYVNSLKHR